MDIFKKQTILDSSSDYLIAGPGEPIVNVTAFTARQKVSGYLGSNVSHLMGGGEPSLVLSSGRLVWRVPIILASPLQGVMGVVGSLDVDARNSQLIIPSDFLVQVEANAQKVATPL